MYFKEQFELLNGKLKTAFNINKFIVLPVIFISFNLIILPQLSSQNIQNNTKLVSNPLLYNCVDVNSPEILLGPTGNGFIKPRVTDLGTPSDAYFPVLIVFVQFANDPGPDCSWWPRGSAPEYMDEMIASQKKYPKNGNWWDTYSEKTELLSDYWLEQSRGHFHVVGKAVSIILDHDYRYYQGNGDIERISDDIYEKLNMLGTIDWRQFDKWSTSENANQFSIQYIPDGYVDMIYKVFRSHAPKIGMPAGGVASLGESLSQGMNYLIDPVNHIYINGDYYYLGSGLTLTPGFGGDETDSTSYFPYAALSKTGVASFSEHEHGHYIFGPGHSGYGKMSGSGAPYGVDECLSPWESIFLGYMEPRIVDFNIHNYEIGDFSSRNSGDTGEVLQVPVNIAFNNEFFLIANRTKVSSYDRIMWGDTAHGDPYRIINPEYGKGVYIYHVSGGYYYPSGIDQECADGLYSWNFQGYELPDWSNEQELEYYTRGAVSYDNDVSLGSKVCADGKSIFTWFGTGQRHNCLGCDGMDKIFTNKTEAWTSREFQGDRWDAWNVGYNEVFSPYSSPSTKDWNNNNTGIFIWLCNSTGSNKYTDFRIYRTGFDGLTEDSILALTPPSKPMGLISSLSECIDGFQYPLISWNQNKEPDMINPSSGTKLYKIYRAKTDLSRVPSEYSYLTTVNINKDSISYFIDYSEPFKCGNNLTSEAIRYKISAVDNREWESVKSDFASLVVKKNIVSEDNFNHISPFTYELKQNYPNPFNPETEITFSMGKSGFVKMTVYNILGELVSFPVNDFRQPGVYKVKFNGSGLASGIYFYHIETPGFVQTKKMVLIK